MFPAAPVVGVGAVVLHEGRVLLVKRGKEPLRGAWVVPGGAVELGESLEEAVVREVMEETGISVRPLEALTVFDRIEREGEAVRFHYVIVDYLCAYGGGTCRAASDAEDARFVPLSELGASGVPEAVRRVVGEAVRRIAVAPGGPSRLLSLK